MTPPTISATNGAGPGSLGPHSKGGGAPSTSEGAAASGAGGLRSGGVAGAKSHLALSSRHSRRRAQTSSASSEGAGSGVMTRQ